MDAVGWAAVVAVFALLWAISPGFRVAMKWGAAGLVALLVIAGTVYPGIWDALPGIVNALWQP
ncbi:MAG: hypothetical protein ACRD0P_15290 [Stackebrandtia sp.]